MQEHLLQFASHGDLAHRLGQLPVADHETRGATAVIPSHGIDAHADHLGDVEALADISHQLSRRGAARRRGDAHARVQPQGAAAAAAVDGVAIISAFG